MTARPDLTLGVDAKELGVAVLRIHPWTEATPDVRIQIEGRSGDGLDHLGPGGWQAAKASLEADRVQVVGQTLELRLGERLTRHVRPTAKVRVQVTSTTGETISIGQFGWPEISYPVDRTTGRLGGGDAQPVQSAQPNIGTDPPLLPLVQSTPALSPAEPTSQQSPPVQPGLPRRARLLPAVLVGLLLLAGGAALSIHRSGKPTWLRSMFGIEDAPEATEADPVAPPTNPGPAGNGPEPPLTDPSSQAPDARRPDEPSPDDPSANSPPQPALRSARELVALGSSAGELVAEAHRWAERARQGATTSSDDAQASYNSALELLNQAHRQGSAEAARDLGIWYDPLGDDTGPFTTTNSCRALDLYGEAAASLADARARREALVQDLQRRARGGDQEAARDLEICGR